MSHTQSRKSNYEQILRILNDTLQGTTVGLGFILGGTREFLYDTRRGLYSYEALQSRLAQNTFAKDNLVDLTGPVLELTVLTQEDFYVLLKKIRHVYAVGDQSKYLISDEGIMEFMQYCSNRIGDTYFRTPRTTITSFINLLAVLEQNQSVSLTDLIGKIDVRIDYGYKSDNEFELDPDDELISFKL